MDPKRNKIPRQSRHGTIKKFLEQVESEALVRLNKRQLRKGY